MPKGFQFPMQNPAPALWTTLADDATDKDPITAQRGADMLTLVGRLKPASRHRRHGGPEPDRAQLSPPSIPTRNKQPTGAVVVPELENLVGNTRPALHVLFAAVVFRAADRLR